MKQTLLSVAVALAGLVLPAATALAQVPGKKVWEKSFPLASEAAQVMQGADQVVVGQDSSVWFTGRLMPGHDFTFGSTTLSTTRPSAYLAKLSKQGEPLWAVKFEGTGSVGEASITALDVDAQGYAYVAGQFRDTVRVYCTDGYVLQGLPQANDKARGFLNFNPWLTKLTPSGGSVLMKGARSSRIFRRGWLNNVMQIDTSQYFTPGLGKYYVKFKRVEVRDSELVVTAEAAGNYWWLNVSGGAYFDRHWDDEGNITYTPHPNLFVASTDLYTNNKFDYFKNQYKNGLCDVNARITDVWMVNGGNSSDSAYFVMQGWGEHQVLMNDRWFYNNVNKAGGMVSFNVSNSTTGDGVNGLEVMDFNRNGGFAESSWYSQDLTTTGSNVVAGANAIGQKVYFAGSFEGKFKRALLMNSVDYRTPYPLEAQDGSGFYSCCYDTEAKQMVWMHPVGDGQGGVEVPTGYIFKNGVTYLSGYLKDAATGARKQAIGYLIDAEGNATRDPNAKLADQLRAKGNLAVALLNDGDTKRIALYELTDSVSNLTGDITGDGAIDTQDVTALVDKILGNDTYADEVCDLDGDGKINTADVTALVSLILNR